MTNTKYQLATKIDESLLAIRSSARKMAETFGVEEARDNIASDVYLYCLPDREAPDALREMMIAAAEDELEKVANEQSAQASTIRETPEGPPSEA